MPHAESECNSNDFNNDIFFKVISNVADILNDEAKQIRIIGLGSGRTVALFMKELGRYIDMKEFEFVTTSMQIRFEAERFDTRFGDERKIPDIDIVIDGADQIDSDFNMIKGGGGALFKEKIVMYCSKKRIILAGSEKFVYKFDFPLPVEVHPFARSSVLKRLNEYGIPNIRIGNKDFPFMTENGNIIYDISGYKYKDFDDIKAIERDIKNIPGVIEVGLFPKLTDTIFYKIDKEKGSFEKILI